MLTEKLNKLIRAENLLNYGTFSLIINTGSDTITPLNLSQFAGVGRPKDGGRV